MRSLLLLCVGLAAAGCASAAIEQCESDALPPTDKVSLLQIGNAHVTSASDSVKTVKQHEQVAASAHTTAETGAKAAGSAAQHQSPCACLNFKNVYSSGLSCGYACELAPPNPNKAFNETERIIMHDFVHMGPELCVNFYTHLDTTSCANVEIGPVKSNWKGGSWCFVSDSCPTADLGYGAVIPGSGVAWKTCSSSDSLLSSKPPADLITMAAAQGLDFGLLVKEAYKTYPKGMLLTQADQIKVQSTASAPLVMDSMNGHPTYNVVSNGTIYQIDFSSNMDPTRPNTMTVATCIAGCPR